MAEAELPAPAGPPRSPALTADPPGRSAPTGSPPAAVDGYCRDQLALQPLAGQRQVAVLCGRERSVEVYDAATRQAGRERARGHRADRDGHRRQGRDVRDRRARGGAARLPPHARSSSSVASISAADRMRSPSIVSAGGCGSRSTAPTRSSTTRPAGGRCSGDVPVDPRRAAITSTAATSRCRREEVRPCAPHEVDHGREREQRGGDEQPARAVAVPLEAADARVRARALAADRRPEDEQQQQREPGGERGRS